jgi:hypothetical protein
MLRIDKYADFETLAREVEYGRIEGVDFYLDDDDPALRSAEHDGRAPARKFANFLRRKKGVCSFSVLKIQDGLPMYGESEIKEGAYQSHRFA